MYVLFGLAALALAPSGDPRSIDPAANRPEIVAPGGSPTRVEPPPTRSPKGTPTKPEPAAEPEPAGEPRPEPTSTSSPWADDTADVSPARCLPARGRCWKLSVAGIALASVGVAALGTGIGFMQAPQYPVPEEPIYNRSLRPPGVAMVTVGAVSLVTGAAMIVVGHVVHKRSGRQPMARVRLAPGGLQW